MQASLVPRGRLFYPAPLLLPQAGEGARANRECVLKPLIDGKDLGAIHRNLAADFHDHNGPEGESGLAAKESTISGLHKLMPDVAVELRDIVADGDLVMVHNVWSGTNAKTGKRIEAHGFVQWRLEDGKIVERWATVTRFKPLETPTFEW